MKKLLLAMCIGLVGCTDHEEKNGILQTNIDSILYEHHRHFDTIVKYGRISDYIDRENDISLERQKLQFERETGKPASEMYMSFGKGNWDELEKIKNHSDTLNLLEDKYSYLIRLKQITIH